jgi:Uma2 family endonuclease
MATGTLISVREYLSTSYHPDRDYVDGLVIERNVGELDHSQLQTDLSTYLNVRRQQWGIRVFVEQRVQVRPKRFRVPDICIVTGGRPNEQILTSPPLACIEILSKDDRMSDMQERIDDYLGFGVSYVWVIDPRTRKTYEFTSGGMHEVKELRVEKPEMSVPLDAVFE